MPVLGIETVRVHLRSGDRVMVTLPGGDEPEVGPRYALMSGRGVLRRATFDNLLPELQPSGDGLFPEEQSQTYRLAD